MKPEVIEAFHVTSGHDRDIASKLGFALPESKFQPPAARPGIVARTALVGQLAATRAPVITVAAPPGYGKTTLMAQWAERIGSHAAWLSCDEADNDPVVLLSALAVALDRIGPVDPAIFSVLASSGADITVIPRFMSAVALVQPPVTVILDHAEAVTDSVLALVASLGGSISSEHGVGRAKAPWLGLSRSQAEIDVMRSIKAAFDPYGLLNPGVLF